jgi:hypothetical protein
MSEVEPTVEPGSESEYILNRLYSEWERQFIAKNVDYKNNANRLGLSGAYVDVDRKVAKLKRALWYGQKLNGEQPREILMDLIGHCFLIIAAIDRGVKIKE